MILHFADYTYIVGESLLLKLGDNDIHLWFCYWNLNGLATHGFAKMHFLEASFTDWDIDTESTSDYR